MKQITWVAVAGVMAVVAGSAMADEGMWTLDHLPLQQMQQRYGFIPSQAWIDRVQHATVRLAEGCSGAFVSADGLVMTNHHCANSCLSQLSAGGRDYMADGFSAAKAESEPKCPDVELDQLESISDVTARVDAATAGKRGADRIRVEQAISSQLESSCTAGDAKTWRCDVVALYHGGRHALYKYRRYQDVRLVFAPEQAIAAFGGDPDNFNFPRYDLDVTFLRAYVDGKPARTPQFLPFDAHGPKAGEMTFVVGNPGSTQRETPWLQLAALRDDSLIPLYGYLSELRGVLWQYSRADAQQAREAQELLYNVEAGLKTYQNQLATLGSERLAEQRQQQDAALRDWIAADPARRTSYGDPWADLERAVQRGKVLQARYDMIANGRGFGVLGTQLFYDAMMLVQGAAERTKPDAERRPAFREANLPAMEQSLESTGTVYPRFEQLMMAWSLEKLRQSLGADDPFVHAVLGTHSPGQLAQSLFDGSRLADPAERKRLWEGGQQAIAASADPMIVLARKVVPEAAAIRQRYEAEVVAPIRTAGEAIARARFARDGAVGYPDATFTPRLSYGKVAGWKEGDREVPPFTDFAGLYRRATGADPYKLPDSWLKAKPALALSTSMNFVSDNDVTGGNSGSPVIDREGRAVGLLFDGNIHMIGGDFAYDGGTHRAIAVDAAALDEALRKVYRLSWLADELARGHR